MGERRVHGGRRSGCTGTAEESVRAFQHGRSSLLRVAVVTVLMVACAAPAAAANGVVAWGANHHGQLGDGSTAGSDVPVAVCAPKPAPCPGSHLEKVIAVSAGGEHSLALLESGEVVAWGTDKEGALGDHLTHPEEKQPVYVCEVNDTAPECTETHVTNRLEHVAAISAGNALSNVALLENGEVVTWGSNSGGQLGIGEESPPVKYSDVPVRPCALGADNVTCPSPNGPYLEHIHYVAAAPAHDVALAGSAANGEAVSWGADKVGQLGRGDWYKTHPGINRAEPVCEPEFSGDFGRLTTEPFGPVAGENKSPPTCSLESLSTLKGVVGVSFGLQHNLALVYGFPAGHEFKEDENEEERKLREAEEEEARRKCEEENGPEGKGGEGCLAVVAWGFNDDGQLGDREEHGGPNHCWTSHLPCSEVPIPVCEAESAGPEPCDGDEGLRDASAVAAGGSHSLALVNGDVLAWGEAGYGTLGNHQLTNSYVPEYVCKVSSGASPPHCGSNYEYLEEVSAIAAGEFHNLALLYDGQVVAWGQNEFGQLGNHEEGSGAAPEICSGTGCSKTPVAVCEVGYSSSAPCGSGNHLEGVTAVSAGRNHNLAVGTFSFAPVWYKKTEALPKNGAHVVVATKGTITFGYGVTTCTLKDSEEIWNPVGNAAGEDEITAFTLTGCKSAHSPCPSGQQVEVVAEGLPWHTGLIGSPVRDEIQKMIFYFKCSGGGPPLEQFFGTLTPEVVNEELVFTMASGELEGGVPPKRTTLIGTDKIPHFTAH